MKLQVLIIDDDRVVIMMQEKMVINSLFHPAPISFLNGKLGLDYIINNINNEVKYFVLLDINMPVMNGWEFLDAVNQHAIADRILVAIVTSSTNESDRQRAFQYKQVIKYIEKPVSIQKLSDLKKEKELSIFFK